MTRLKAHAPDSEAEAADFVRKAHAKGTPLEIVGGGTRRAIGRPPQTQATLSSSALTGIVHYDPGELVVVANAGTRLKDVVRALDKAGQRLVFEPADSRALLKSKGEPTIGSVAATNNSGPRRFVSGAARDSLLGVRFVNGQGEIVTNGGRVMKNVTGLDLVKLMAGSWGTLGFLTEVTFKVLPKPETELTLALRGLLDADAIAALATVMATSCEVSGAAHLPEMTTASVLGGKLGTEPATLVRLEGFGQSVRIRAARLKDMLSGLGPVDEIGDGDSRTLWAEVRDAIPVAGGDHPVWKISMAPSQGHLMVMDVRMRAPVSAFYDWQGGLVWLRMENGEAEAASVRSLVARHGGGHAVLVRADAPTRAAVPVFEPLSKPLEELSRRIKAQFDPKGILNPGRMGL